MYKRVPCRHFEPSSGKPLGLGCGKGDSCRFIHPDDSNWRNVKKDYDQGFTRKSPLTPQTYAFRRHQRDLSSSPRYQRDNRHFTKLGRDKEIRRPPNPSDRDLQTNFHRGDTSRRRSPIARREVQQKDAFQGIIKTEETQVEQKEAFHMPKENTGVATVRHPIRVDLNQENSGQVWNAFLQIARLTRESDMLAEQQKKEEAKMVTYAAVEQTLNEISSQMGLAVIPQIEQSTVVQEDCKKTIAENNETVNRLCKDVVQHFVADVNNAVDKHLQAALHKIKDETDTVSREIQKRVSQSTAFAPRWEGPVQGLESSWSSQDLDKGTFRTKRRRMRSPSPYSPRGSTSKEGLLTSSEVMKELEARIERQAQTLIDLAKENEKLRAQNMQLRNNSPVP